MTQLELDSYKNRFISKGPQFGYNSTIHNLLDYEEHKKNIMDELCNTGFLKKEILQVDNNYQPLVVGYVLSNKEHFSYFPADFIKDRVIGRLKELLFTT